MVNGDPTTFMFTLELEIYDPINKSTYSTYASIGASNYEEAKVNLVNCYKRWYPNHIIKVN